MSHRPFKRHKHDHLSRTYHPHFAPICIARLDSGYRGDLTPGETYVMYAKGNYFGFETNPNENSRGDVKIEPRDLYALAQISPNNQCKRVHGKSCGLLKSPNEKLNEKNPVIVNDLYHSLIWVDTKSQPFASDLDWFKGIIKSIHVNPSTEKVDLHVCLDGSTGVRYSCIENKRGYHERSAYVAMWIKLDSDPDVVGGYKYYITQKLYEPCKEEWLRSPAKAMKGTWQPIMEEQGKAMVTRIRNWTVPNSDKLMKGTPLVDTDCLKKYLEKREISDETPLQVLLGRTICKPPGFPTHYPNNFVQLD